MQNAVSCMKANRVHMHSLFGSLATTRTQFNKWIFLAFILLICQIAILLLILVMWEETFLRSCVADVFYIVQSLWYRGHFIDETKRHLMVLHIGHSLIEMIVLRCLNLSVKVLLICTSVDHIVILDKLGVLGRVEEVWLLLSMRENGWYTNLDVGVKVLSVNDRGVSPHSVFLHKALSCNKLFHFALRLINLILHDMAWISIRARSQSLDP